MVAVAKHGYAVRRGLKVGATVCCPRGFRLGVVEAVRGTCFKIRLPNSPEFWLGKDCVGSIKRGVVQLKLSLPLTEDDNADAPPHAGIHVHREPEPVKREPTRGYRYTTPRLARIQVA